MKNRATRKKTPEQELGAWLCTKETHFYSDSRLATAVDGDDAFELIDAIIIIHYLMNIIDGTELHRENIDANCNGTVNALDALAGLRTALNA